MGKSCVVHIVRMLTKLNEFNLLLHLIHTQKLNVVALMWVFVLWLFELELEEKARKHGQRQRSENIHFSSYAKVRRTRKMMRKSRKTIAHNTHTHCCSSARYTERILSVTLRELIWYASKRSPHASHYHPHTLNVFHSVCKCYYIVYRCVTRAECSRVRLPCVLQLFC